MTTKRRNKGDGSWGKKTINGIEYIRFQKKYEGAIKKKDFYGKTHKEVKEKIKKYELEQGYQLSVDVKKTILTDYIFNWIENVKKKTIKINTYDTFLDTLKYYIKDTELGNMQMGNIKSQIIQDHYNAMADKYSMSSIKKVHSLLCQVFKYAIIKQDILKNPLLTVTVPSKDNVKESKEIEILTDEQMNKLFIEAQKVNTYSSRINGKIGETVYRGNNKYIIILILYTGMRIGEALAVTWNDYNKKEKTLTIHSNLVRVKDVYDKDTDTYSRKDVINSTKTRSGTRIIKLPKKAIWALDGLSKDKKSQRICVTTTGNTPSQSSITRTLKCMLSNAEIDVDIKHFGLHDLRHTYASYQIRHGTDIIVVSKLIGHRSPETTMKIYAHIVEEQKIKAIEIFDNDDEQ